MFSLHPNLARDCLEVATLSACRLLLMNDSRHPWLILVPMREGLRDLDELTPEETAAVWTEIRLASRLLRDQFHPEKLNIASLGNLVPQLHIHIIARFTTDPDWPHPVWGRNPPLPYPPLEAEQLIKALRDYLLDASHTQDGLGCPVRMP